MKRKYTKNKNKNQADAIRQWQPWKNSTGPKTAAGKDKAKMNAMKDGEHDVTMRKLRKVLHNQIQWLKSLK